MEALYQSLLGRTGSPGDLAFWVDQASTLGDAAVALAFEQTPEYRTDVVEADYLFLLDRPADAAGLNGWVFSGLDLSSVRIGIESSPEFFANG